MIFLGLFSSYFELLAALNLAYISEGLRNFLFDNLFDKRIEVVIDDIKEFKKSISSFADVISEDANIEPFINQQNELSDYIIALSSFKETIRADLFNFNSLYFFSFTFSIVCLLIPGIIQFNHPTMLGTQYPITFFFTLFFVIILFLFSLKTFKSSNSNSTPSFLLSKQGLFKINSGLLIFWFFSFNISNFFEISTQNLMPSISMLTIPPCWIIVICIIVPALSFILTLIALFRTTILIYNYRKKIEVQKNAFNSAKAFCKSFLLFYKIVKT